MFRNITKFAWRNIWRNKRRTGLTLLAIVIGLISLIFGRGYIEGAKKNIMEPIIKTQSGHIRLVHEEYLRLERVIPKDKVVAPVSGIDSVLKQFPEIESEMRLIKFRTLAAYGEENEACLAFGISPGDLKRTLEMDQYIRKGNYFSGNGSELLLGEKLAKKLGVQVGDELLLVATDINYSTYALPFRITGIFSLGGSFFDKSVIFIGFENASEMMDYDDACQEILLMIDRPEEARQIAESIQRKITGIADSGVRAIPWEENDVAKNTLPLLNLVWGSILYLLMFIVALVILNTMLMTVMERYREIGIIKAMGFKNRDVIAMIFTEAFYIGLIGSLIGGALGALLTGIVGKTGIDFSKALNPDILEDIEIPFFFFNKPFYPDLTFFIVLGSILFGIVTALVAVIYPALKSTRMSPVEAFRSELKV